VIIAIALIFVLSKEKDENKIGLGNGCGEDKLFISKDLGITFCYRQNYYGIPPIDGAPIVEGNKIYSTNEYGGNSTQIGKIEGGGGACAAGAAALLLL
jgi:hypothetical protein